MFRSINLAVILALLIAMVPVGTAQAQPIPDFCIQGTHAGVAEFLICVPEDWNGDLIVYAHGYVAFNEPIGIPWDQLILPDGTLLPEIITDLGFAFATTSYSVNGLAIKEGIAEVVDIVDVFESLYSVPNLVLLGGVSEGGIITALAVEQHPEVFDGGLSTCGPIGDFIGQVNYWGNFRIAFDYFFPDLLPGDPTGIPDDVIENWDEVYKPALTTAINDNPQKTTQLLSVGKAPIDPDDPDSIVNTVVDGLLWYNVFATNDGIDKLGGQPFDNQDHFYNGLVNMYKMNKNVARYAADQAALDEIEANYQTTGDLAVPLVTLHTTGDEIVPYWHEILYKQKVKANGDEALYAHIPALRYGHCMFEVNEVVAGLAILLWKVNGQELEGVNKVLNDPQSLQDYQEIIQNYGVMP